MATGPSAVIAALAISLLQTAPEATWPVYRDIVFKAAHLPIGVVLLALFDALGAQTCAPLILSIGGMISSYWYIRFFKTVDGRRGDRSIALSFPALFPAILHGPTEWLSTTAFRTATKLDRWGWLQGHMTDEENRIPCRRHSAQEMERRRMMALSILNEKMNRKREEMAGNPQDLHLMAETAAETINSQENNRPQILAQMA